MDGESEEEQESAGTGDEEDGDESDLVTPALRAGCQLGRMVRSSRAG